MTTLETSRKGALNGAPFLLDFYGTLRIIQVGGWVNYNIPAHKVLVRTRFGEYIPVQDAVRSAGSTNRRADYEFLNTIRKKIHFFYLR